MNTQASGHVPLTPPVSTSRRDDALGRLGPIVIQPAAQCQQRAPGDSSDSIVAPRDRKLGPQETAAGQIAIEKAEQEKRLTSFRQEPRDPAWANAEEKTIKGSFGVDALGLDEAALSVTNRFGLNLQFEDRQRDQLLNDLVQLENLLSRYASSCESAIDGARWLLE